MQKPKKNFKCKIYLHGKRLYNNLWKLCYLLIILLPPLLSSGPAGAERSRQIQRFLSLCDAHDRSQINEMRLNQ